MASKTTPEEVELGHGVDSSDSDVLLLARHGEATKNLRNQHGGPGTGLTELGRAQVARLAAIVSEYGVARVLAVSRPHCVESAAQICEALALADWVPLGLEPYNLGVLDGLSDDEVRNLDSDLAVRMDQYRAGTLDIAEVHIPDADSPYEYAHRSAEVLANLIGSGSTAVVGTRSVLVSLCNVLLGRRPAPGGGWREIPWPNGGYVVYSHSEQRFLAASGVRVPTRTSAESDK